MKSFWEIGVKLKNFLILSHLYKCMIDTCKHSNAMAFSLGLSPWGQKASTLQQSCVDKSCFFLLLDSFALAQWSNHLVHSRGFPLLIYHITQFYFLTQLCNNIAAIAKSVCILSTRHQTLLTWLCFSLNLADLNKENKLKNLSTW